MSNLQKQVNVLEEIEGEGCFSGQCSEVITRTCLKESITKQDFNNLLSKGAKVITVNNWSLKKEFSWYFKPSRVIINLKAHCAGPQYIIEGNKNLLNNIDRVKQENQKNLTISLKKNNIERYKYLASEKFNSSPAEGVEILDKAIETNPKDPSLFLSRGILRNYSGDSLGAKIDFDQALEIDPKYHLTYLYRSLLNASISENENSLKDILRYSDSNFKKINAKCFMSNKKVKESRAISVITQDYRELFGIIIIDKTTVPYLQIIYAEKGRIKDDKLILSHGKIITVKIAKPGNEVSSFVNFAEYNYPIKNKDTFLNKCNNILSSM